MIVVNTETALLLYYRERSMELLLSLESNNSIAWYGMSDMIIGTLKPGASMDIPLCLITLETGIIVSNYSFI